MRILITVFFALFFSVCSMFGVAEKSTLSDESLLLRVKLLMTTGEGGQEELEYVQAALSMVTDERLTHEVNFYQALLLIKSEHVDKVRVVRLLEKASQENHPLAIALLYKIYSEPFLVEEKCMHKAENLKSHYMDLYHRDKVPAEFSTALSAVNKMVS